MHYLSRRLFFLFLALSVAAVLVLVTGQGVRARAADKQAPQASPATPVDASQYVGADTCKTCHEDVYTG